MYFLFGCSTRLINNAAGSILFKGPRLSTRRVLTIRRHSTPHTHPRRAFASALPPLAEDVALLAVGGSGLIKLK
jgi:hypothetical protein